MKIGIISDLHSNKEALTSVLNHLQNVDKIICLGDIVGYGPEPNECCEIIRSLNCKTVAGNHDLAAIGAYDISYFNPYAKEAILWTQERLSVENKNYLRQLKEIEIINEGDLNITLVHGSLTNPATDYITNKYEAKVCFDLMDTDLCFVGHSHIAEVYYKKKSSLPVLSAAQQTGLFIEAIGLGAGGQIFLQKDFQFIINYGSVGQPRDGNPQSSFGILDLDRCEVLVKRVDYSIEITQEKMRKFELPPYLYRRLEIGR